MTDEEEQIELTLAAQLEPGQASTSEPIALNEQRYRIQKALGEGAMGEVLLAKDQNLQRKVAYKQIHGHISENKQVIGRFLKEAQITAQLPHPNIVPVYNLEVTSEGQIAYSMKLVAGQTMKELIQEAQAAHKRGEFPDEEHNQEALLNHFLKVCDAMHYSHSRGVIHRDLKPANIMIGAYNEVYVMDWGIARVISEPEDVISDELVHLIEPDQNEPLMERTQLGKVLGTPRYMSPQQAADKNDSLDGRSDQFTLGLILFELVTLKPAFTAKDQVSLLKRILKVELEPYQHLNPKIKLSPELEAIIRKATAKKPENRYPTTRAMAEDIRRYLRGHETQALPDTFSRKILRWMGHHQQATLLIFCLGFVGCAGIIGGSILYKQITLKQAKVHEVKLQQFQQTVLQKTQVLDSRFIQIEGILQAMGAVAIERLSKPQPPKSSPLFWSDQFDPNLPRPSDLKQTTGYTGQISLEYPVFKQAPDTKKTQLAPSIQRLLPLEPLLRKALISSLPNAHTLSPAAQRNAIGQGKTPLIWANIALKEGLMITYPGTRYGEAYDPRKRPWYRVTVNQEGIVWGTPYPDTQGQGLLLSCTLPMYDYAKHFRGVASVDLILNQVGKQWLPLTHSALKKSFIVNHEGGIILELNQAQEMVPNESMKGDILDLKLYPQTEVRTRIQQKQQGYLETQDTLYMYYPIETLGWYYIAEADSSELFQQDP